MASSSSSLSAPTSRSRTNLFLSYRDSRTRTTSRFTSRARHDDLDNDADDDEHAQLMGDRRDHVTIDVPDLPPKWVDTAEQVESILAAVQTKIGALDKMHAKHVLPGFTDRTGEEREIESVTTDITKDFRKCQALITRIAVVANASSASASSHSGVPSRNEAQTAKNVQRGLAAKVQELSATFRKKQRVYMEQLQGHAIKNQDLMISSGAVSLKGPEAISAVDDDVAAATTQSQVTLQQALPPDVRRRNQELNEIANSISQLGDLFKDLSALVIDQGTLLDSVEYNIEQTSVHVAEAARELTVATKYQKNAGRRKCILLLVIIIFGLIVVLIFKPRRHDSAAPPKPSDMSSSAAPIASPTSP